MASNTPIEWCDHTINFWWGCAKVSPACAHCYAEGQAARFHAGLWGPDGERRIRVEAARKEALRYERRAVKEGRRFRVFTNSMADFFEDRRDLDGARLEALDVIRQTPHLDWLILTKRPEAILGLLHHAEAEAPGSGLSDWLRDWMHGRAPMNVWLGTTVEDQERADQRIPALLQVPAAVRFLSCEPLLSSVNLSHWVHGQRNGDSGYVLSGSPLDGHRGSDLASSGSGCSDQASEGGYWSQREGRLSKNPDDRCRGAVDCGSTPNRLDAVERQADPRRLGDQSSERQEVGQPPRESRVGFSGPECSPQLPRVGANLEGSGRREEHLCEVDRGIGSANSAHEGSCLSEAFRGTVRRESANRLGNSTSENLEAPALIHWVIAGGESGPHARPMHPDWARGLRDQCAAAGVPFLLKQWGEFVPLEICPGHHTSPSDHSRGALYLGIKDQRFCRVGKARAGRLLDGVEHNDFPEVTRGR